MSTVPPPFDPSDDADEQYRRASELDPSRPSEATRRAVLAEAARLAAVRARREQRRRWPSLIGAPLSWRPAVTGTIAAAVLAAVVIAPEFLAPTEPAESRRAPASPPPPAASATPPTTARPVTEEHAPPPVPREPSGQAGRAVALQRAPVAADRAVRSAPAAAGPAVPESAPAAREALTARQLEEGVDANATAAVGVASRVPLTRPVAAPRVPADPDALRQAAAAGDLAALTAQLASGTAIDARDAQGRTALLLATLNGQTNAVALLLAQGADPSAADARGETPLQAAVAADERGIVALLRRYGAR